MIQTTPQSESFSELKEITQNSLAGIQVFDQAYSKNTFGKLDSLHRDLGKAIVVFDSLLSNVRRLPKDIEKLEQDKIQLDQLLANIKNANGNDLTALVKELEGIFLFAGEGTTETRYGVFKRKIVNFGYIDGGTKSWEEK